MKVLPIGTLAECHECHIWHDVAFLADGNTYCFDHAPTNMGREERRQYLRSILIEDGSIC